MPVKINIDKCTGCEECLASCPVSAIEMKDSKAFINEYCEACMTCINICPEGAIIEVDKEATQETDLKSYKGVWIFAEQRNGKVSSVAYELLGIGRTLAGDLNTELAAVLFGAPESEARELIKWGADKVYQTNNPIFDAFNDEPYSQLMTSLIQTHKPARRSNTNRPFFFSEGGCKIKNRPDSRLYISCH
jgi:electron transfer flavoprotein alpha subunit